MSNDNNRSPDAEASANTNGPLARRENLTVRELPDETLVYDLDRRRMHCLNRTSALVWRHCDGQRDLPALVAVVTNVLKLPEAEATAATQLALEQLNRRELLQHGTTAPLLEDQRTTRRDALRRLVTLTASALPVVMTLRSPPIAWAAGQACRSSDDCAAGEFCLQNPAGPHFSQLQGQCVEDYGSSDSSDSSSSSPTVPTCVRTCVYDLNGNLSNSSISGCAPCNAGGCPPNGPANGVTGINGTC